jgi:hypothetical protein
MFVGRDSDAIGPAARTDHIEAKVYVRARRVCFEATATGKRTVLGRKVQYVPHCIPKRMAKGYFYAIFSEVPIPVFSEA